MARPVVITRAPVSPEEDRHRRVVSYTVMMAIRFACFIAVFFVEGWWQLACLVGAVLLPYLAVTRANVHGDPHRVTPEAPERPGLPTGRGE
ncbi:MAG TPA: DUF3099 domain-containing protein [Microbacteriaceae bacterium]|nr:DUF3099 domain-containing protein [Microbacteriaceae bacterium]